MNIQMLKCFVAFFAVSSTLLLSSPGFAAAEKPAAATTAETPSLGVKAGLADFRVGQFSMFQADGTSYAASAAWTPWFNLNGTFGLRGLLGVGTYKPASDMSESSIGVVADVMALGTYNLNQQIMAEFGPGMQYWFDGKDKPFTLNAGAVYQFSSKQLWVIDGVSLMYSPTFLMNNFTHQIRLGATF
jgi:hypothetical protein